jgi:hypothetical protein
MSEINEILAKALHGQPIENLDDVSEGTIIQAICEDGQSRIGMYIRGMDGSPRLVPLSTKIPLTRQRTARKSKRNE